MRNKAIKIKLLLFCAAILFSGCTNILEPSKPQTESPALGSLVDVGYLRILVEGEGSSARTIAPPASAFTYTVIFEKGGIIEEEQPFETGLFELTPGLWSITVRGYLDKEGDIILAGEGQTKNISISAGQSITVSLRLKPWTDTMEKGSFSYSVDFSDLSQEILNAVVRAALTIEPLEGGGIIERNLLDYPAESPGRGTETLPPGFYMVTVRAEIVDSRFFVRSDLAHIYPLCEISFEDIVLEDGDFDAKIYLSGTLPVDVNVGIVSVDLVVYDNEACEGEEIAREPLSITPGASKDFALAVDAAKVQGSIYLRPELKDGGDDCYGESLPVQNIPREGISGLALPVLKKYSVSMSKSGPKDIVNVPSLAFGGKKVSLSPDADLTYRINDASFSILKNNEEIPYTGNGYVLDPYTFAMPFGDVIINAETEWGCLLEITGTDFSALTEILPNVTGDSVVNPYPIKLRGMNESSLIMIKWVITEVFFALELEGNQDFTSIGKYPFQLLFNMVSIIIPDSVTTIESEAFSGCHNLTSISIPDSVISIGDSAFYYCNSLASISIPDSVTSIEDGIFSSCSSLVSVNIPDTLTSIGERAFEGCNSLVSINIPDTLTSIGERAFEGCNSLVSINIPDTLTSIGERAFSCCSNLVSINLPITLTSIGRAAFSGCNSLVSIIIPDTLTSIGDSAFYGCSSLSSLSIPDSVTSIGDRAFSGCTSTVFFYRRIPPSLGTYAFGSSLSTIFVPKSALDSYKTALSGIGISEYIVQPMPEAVEELGGYLSILPQNDASTPYYIAITDLISGNFEALREIMTNNLYKYIQLDLSDCDMASIDDYAFQYCSSLVSIIIPDSVTSMGWLAFSGCSSLKSINIPDTVNEIGGRAFENCSSLESIIIPNSVTSIGYGAFWECTSLKSIFIPDTVNEIGGRAFENCSSLASITIPNSVISIEVYTFSGCSSLESISIPNSVDSIGQRAFVGCSSLESIIIPDSVTSIGQNAFEGCCSLESIIIPNSVTSIGYGAFWECTSLKSIFIPDTITSIMDYTFVFCSSLESITIPDSVTSIGYGAFHYCTSLESIIIPDSVMVIENNAFNNCSSLASINIPDSVTYIGDAVFMSCINLISITIPNLVTSIAIYAFENCSNLESIYFQSISPPNIDNEFVPGCYKLNAIYVPAESVSAYRTALADALAVIGKNVNIVQAME